MLQSICTNAYCIIEQICGEYSAYTMRAHCVVCYKILMPFLNWFFFSILLSIFWVLWARPYSNQCARDWVINRLELSISLWCEECVRMRGNKKLIRNWTIYIYRIISINKQLSIMRISKLIAVHQIFLWNQRRIFGLVAINHWVRN